jgi:hypothetical protein
MQIKPKITLKNITMKSIVKISTQDTKTSMNDSSTAKIVDYEDKKYYIANVSYFSMETQASYNLPFIIDFEDYELVKNQIWSYVGANYIGSSCLEKGEKKIIYMHNQLMGNPNFQGKGAQVTVDHINRIGRDNRKANLKLSTQSEQNYNQNKRTRSVQLPEGCGIDPDEIPTNIEYHAEDGPHGEYFEVVLKDKGKKVVRVKTTKSKKETLQRKLNEAKIIMNRLIVERPELFEDRCINGELFEQGKALYRSYFEILRLAGIQDPFIKEDITKYSPSTLLVVDEHDATQKSNKNMPDPSTGITKLPQYCRYGKATTTRGDYFEYEKRDNGARVVKTTSKSKAMATKAKYDNLIATLTTENLLAW